jgi:hypothetical protein
MLRSIPPVLALLITGVAAAQTPADSLTMGPDSIGQLRRDWVQADVLVLGLPFDRTVLLTEGDPYTIYTVKFDSRRSAAIWFLVDGASTRLSTESPAFSTSEGAHVGNTLAELQEIYRRGEVFISEEEGLTFTFLPWGFAKKAPTISFAFDTAAITHDCIYDRKKCGNLGASRSTSFASTW